MRSSALRRMRRTKWRFRRSHVFVPHHVLRAYRRGPVELVNKLRAQVTAVRESVQHAFDQPLSTCLVELEKSDAAARVHDPNAPLEGRLTAAKVLVSAAYVYLDAIWSMYYLFC